MTHIIVDAEGRAVGRMTLGSPLGWVDPQHAYTFETVTRDVLAIAAHFGGEIVEYRKGIM